VRIGLVSYTSYWLIELGVIWGDIWAYEELYRRGELCTII